MNIVVEMCYLSFFLKFLVFQEFQLPILKVAVTELVSGVSGETEQKIRLLFDKAIEVSPCVLLLDDIDAIGSKRDNAHREMERRIVSQLVACLDGRDITKLNHLLCEICNNFFPKRVVLGLSNPKRDVEVNADDINVDISIKKVHKENPVLVIGNC